MPRVLVTGSTTGLGLATAEYLLDHGQEVVLHARSKQGREALAGLLERGAQLVTGDLGDPEQVTALAEQANLPQDPAQLRAAAAQMQHLFDAQGEGPVNWTMAEDIARRVSAGSTPIPGAPEPTGTPGDPNPTPEQIQELRQAAHLLQGCGLPLLGTVLNRTPY